MSYSPTSRAVQFWNWAGDLGDSGISVHFLQEFQLWTARIQNRAESNFTRNMCVVRTLFAFISTLADTVLDSVKSPSMRRVYTGTAKPKLQRQRCPSLTLDDPVYLRAIGRIQTETSLHNGSDVKLTEYLNSNFLHLKFIHLYYSPDVILCS